LLRLRKPGGPVDFEKLAKDGFIPPWWVRPGKPVPHRRPAPGQNLHGSDRPEEPGRDGQDPSTYILTVDPGKLPTDDDFFAASERARARGWPVLVMEGDHNPHWRQPEALVELLEGIR